jgi:mannan endo-1,4-beta-mannosidase
VIDPRPVVVDYRGPEKLEQSEEEHTRSLAARDWVLDTLRALSRDSRIAFGHQDSTAYGVGWAGDADRSDTKSICGAHPAVRGWDLFRIEKGAEQNGDGVNFDLMRERIAKAHAKGAINTVSWHVDNPASGGDAWDTESAVPLIVPGATHHEVYRVYLDRVADFLQTLKDDEGALIPIVFRPFHEHTGGWFWWGANHATDEQFVTLWRFTVEHLRRRRGLDHLLFAISPGAGHVYDEASYLFRYPGDDYVDVMGLDHYYLNDAKGLVEALGIVVTTADKHGKIPALTEFGARDGLSNQAILADRWFSRSFFDPLVRDPVASRIAYALAWRNADHAHFFVPHPSHPGAKDLERVCRDPRFLLEGDLQKP